MIATVSNELWESLALIEHGLVLVLLLTVLLMLVKMKQQRKDPAEYYLSIIEAVKQATGPHALFDSKHVYEAGAASMDMDSIGDGEVRSMPLHAAASHEVT
jgi:hypothetical protein